MTIKPPEPPAEPVYEDIASMPDKEHNWHEFDSDYHQGLTCPDCDAYTTCTLCSPKAEGEARANLDCLRNQAEIRNDRLRGEYIKALNRYEAQMDYYRTLI